MVAKKRRRKQQGDEGTTGTGNAEEQPSETAQEVIATGRKRTKKTKRHQAELKPEVIAASPTATKTKKVKKSHKSTTGGLAASGISSSEQGRTSSKATPQTAAADAASALASALEYRKENEIIVGSNCPLPLQTFSMAKEHLGEELVSALKEQGFTSPTPIQAQTWPLALRGEDIVGVAKTGSGKTLGFLLPAIVRVAEQGVTPVIKQTGARDDRGPACPSVLIIAPTRELVQQIAVEALKFASAVGARSLGIFGGVSKGEQVPALKEGIDILAATPGRLLDFATGDPRRDLEPTVILDSATYVVLDEADKMLDMGFEPDVRKILQKCPPSSKSSLDVMAGTARQTLFFTATWSTQVQAVAAYYTSKRGMKVKIGQGKAGNQLTANKSIMQKVLVVEESAKLAKLKQVIAGTLKGGETAIIFATRKQTCDELEKALAWDPLSPDPSPPVCAWCKALHGDKDQGEREKILGAFRAMTTRPQGKRKAVLVATDVASRGLDIPGVALVVIFDFADHHGDALESYVHRIGRTGRGERQGSAVTFFTTQDVGAAGLVKLLRDASQEVPPQLEVLAKALPSKEGDVQGRDKKGKGKGKGKGGGKGKKAAKGQREKRKKTSKPGKKERRGHKKKNQQTA